MGKNAPIQSLEDRVVRAFVALGQITELLAVIDRRRDDAGVPGYVRGHDAVLSRVRALFQGDETFTDSISSIETIPGEVDDSEAIHVIQSDLALLRGAVAAFLRVRLAASDRTDLGIA